MGSSGNEWKNSTETPLWSVQIYTVQFMELTNLRCPIYEGHKSTLSKLLEVTNLHCLNCWRSQIYTVQIYRGHKSTQSKFLEVTNLCTLSKLLEITNLHCPNLWSSQTYIFQIDGAHKSTLSKFLEVTNLHLPNLWSSQIYTVQIDGAHKSTLSKLMELTKRQSRKCLRHSNQKSTITDLSEIYIWLLVWLCGNILHY